MKRLLLYGLVILFAGCSSIVETTATETTMICIDKISYRDVYTVNYMITDTRYLVHMYVTKEQFDAANIGDLKPVVLAIVEKPTKK